MHNDRMRSVADSQESEVDEVTLAHLLLKRLGCYFSLFPAKRNVLHMWEVFCLFVFSFLGIFCLFNITTFCFSICSPFTLAHISSLGSIYFVILFVKILRIIPPPLFEMEFVALQKSSAALRTLVKKQDANLVNECK